MTKISYIVVPKHEGRHAASAVLSSCVIANAMRLLIALILMSALVAIIILAAHRTVDVQPVQPWSLAPAPFDHDTVPSTIETSPPPSSTVIETPPTVILKREYILCNSELFSWRGGNGYLPPPGLMWIDSTGLSETEIQAMRTALVVFDSCAVIEVRLDMAGRQQLQPNVSTSSLRWYHARSCHKDKVLPEIRIKPSIFIPADGPPHFYRYSIDDKDIFYGTPFLSKWQDLFDSAVDVLDSCIKLMLVWRYGGTICNLEETAAGFLPEFKNLLDERNEAVVLTTDTSVVYSKRSCNSAIGSMLMDYSKFSLTSSNETCTAEEQKKDIMLRAQQQYKGVVYFKTTEHERESSSEVLMAHSQMWW